MNKIHTDKAPAAIGPYSQAMTAGELIFTSGQIPIDPATGAVVGSRAGTALQPERQGDVLLQGEVGQDVEGLEDETQLVSTVIRQLVFVHPINLLAVNQDRP